MLLDRIASLAGECATDLVFVRHGSRHDLYRFGSTMIAIPRHREIRERTALSIIHDCERERRSQP